jgi:hypothetical protein
MNSESDTRPNIELHIEELVLHGFSPSDRSAIGAAVESELARLFAEHRVLPTLGQDSEVARLDGGTFKTSSEATAETTGAQIARTVFQGLGQ